VTIQGITTRIAKDDIHSFMALQAVICGGTDAVHRLGGQQFDQG
jgi:hypothetical protein